MSEKIDLDQELEHQHEPQGPDSEVTAELPVSRTTTTVETDQHTPLSATPKSSKNSFSIWPPAQKTRDAVANRLIETLSSTTVLTKRYGIIPRSEAEEFAKRIEEEAFTVAGAGAIADDDGIEILQVYSKEISKRMLDTIKARSENTATAPVEEPKEEADVGSTARPQSEKTESLDGENTEAQ